VKPLNAYQKYLIEEFAEEYRERRLSRRDLLRRALLITGSIPVTASVLSALGCGSRDDDGETPGTTAGGTEPATTATASPAPPETASPGTAGAIATESIRFPGPASDLLGYLARPRGEAVSPGILVIHENRGLNDHIRNVAERFASQGFVSLAVDLVSRNGGSQADAAQNTGFLGQAAPADLVADLAAYADHLLGLDGVHRGGIGVVGYCFGGGYTWEAAVAIPSVLAAAPYYGPCRAIDQLAASTAAILAIYAGNDARVTSQAEEVRAALEARGAPFELHIYPGTNHAFFNDTGPNYNADAAADAFERTVAWFRRYVA
jgi:carboxymethylenebutenolidase